VNSKINDNYLVWNSLTVSQKDAALSRPPQHADEQFKRQVSQLIASVRQGGDDTLRQLTRKYDGIELAQLEVSAAEKKAAWDHVPADIKSAIETAVQNLKSFHHKQIPAAVSVETMPGVKCWREWRAIERVGLYVPAGQAPLPSTVLMLGVPASIAGCKTKILCSPPLRSGPFAGGMDPTIIVAAQIVGIEKLYKVGGAQAIAAMAYGTETILKVDKIFGPGNTWVTEAKLQVAQDAQGAAYDLPAGPSEVLVYADSMARAQFVAADLLSQAEHGEDSQVLLVSTSADKIKEVQLELERQLGNLDRAEIARKSLQYARFIEVQNSSQAIQIINEYAPEHLILQCADATDLLVKIVNAGSVFVGEWSPESVGDYASGTNHVLPTYGFAKAHGGVSLESFLKPITFQQLSAQRLLHLGPVVEKLAEVEGLDAHRWAVTHRLNAIKAEGKGL